MTSLPVPAAAIVIEDIGPEEVGFDPRTGEASALLNFCRATLVQLAVTPSAVSLVIAGDFAAAVKRRLPDGPYKDNFAGARGASVVAAKTMVVGPEVHVVFPASLFEGSANEMTELFVRRTVVHESQHVAMMQTGEEADDIPDGPGARMRFLQAAHQVILEYRAELGVTSDLRQPFEVVLSAPIVQALQSDLVTVDRTYQRNRDLSALCFYVMQQAENFWKILAWIAAARRGQAAAGPLNVEVAARALWEQMGAERWARFENILTMMPSAHTRLDRPDMDRARAELADLLAEWLEDLGFEFRDINDGPDSSFVIVSTHLLGR